MTIKVGNNAINVGRHLFIWCIVAAYLVILDPVKGSIVAQIPTTFLLLLNYIFIFYSLSLLVLPSFYKGNTLLGVCSAIGSYLVFTSIDYFNLYVLMPQLGIRDFGNESIDNFFFNSFYPLTQIAIPSVSYFLYTLNVEKIQIQNSKERSLLLRELNFLKNQFNSHITFNFLNYCYSKVHKVSNESAEAIDLFSDMLRYSLVTTPGSVVPVEKEIGYIKNFIKLQKLLSKEVHVKFNCEGDVSDKYILPSILITFIENAFTHGEFSRPNTPIQIALKATDSSILLEVYNKKRNSKKLNGTGVGLENVTQLLNLHYENKYRLDLENCENDFKCKLKLNLA